MRELSNARCSRTRSRAASAASSPAPGVRGGSPSPPRLESRARQASVSSTTARDCRKVSRSSDPPVSAVGGAQVEFCGGGCGQRQKASRAML